jgi:inhibitor of nuclear factor kappa-B kinase subunit alpha
MIFQQNWAPAHEAKTTITYLKSNFPEYLTKNQWPSNSPDLNPLNFFVWGFLEQKLKNKKIIDLDYIRRKLTQAWLEIDKNYLRRTVISVKSRLQACVKAKGGHFEQFM